MQKGNIDITTENIFPVIKKFLYSDHEIFLREIVSNAVDATQKLKTYSSKGDFKGEMGDLTIRIAVNKDAKTITISDRGIGMTAEEIDKYINQIAFSGANDFLEKYKNDANAIIGHFGLGFYSSFMVADKVEIITKSYREDAKAVNGLAMEVPLLKLMNVTRRNEEQTSCSTCLKIARNFSKTARSTNCSRSIAASFLSPLPSVRKRNGKTASRLKRKKTIL